MSGLRETLRLVGLPLMIGALFHLNRLIGIYDVFGVGSDSQASVAPDLYRPPFVFTRTITKVKFDMDGESEGGGRLSDRKRLKAASD
jgi:hypothetical protein